ncbi:MAG: hypothetical protein ABI193_16710 [Minicystis sp.]
MRKFLWLMALVAPGFFACNYTVGECYPREQGSGSAGAEGPVIVQGGAGGFGDTPPKQTQDEPIPAPDCNIVSGSPCDEKCLSDYENAAAVCGRIQSDADRRTCQDGAYASYKSCRENCTSVNSCRKTCEDLASACEELCRKLPEGDKLGRSKCWLACNVAFAACVKLCKE